jgi:DNA-binding MarR family transcriptional regulator
MPLVMLQELPSPETLRRAARDYPDLDPTAVEVAMHLARASDRLLRTVERNLARYDLTQARFGVLMALLPNHRLGADAVPLTPSLLAERTAVTPATMTGLVDSLVKDGLVQRTEDPRDRRKIIIHLAARAHALLARILPGHFQQMAAMCGPLSRAERKQLAGLLQKLSRGVAAVGAAQAGRNPAA